MLSNNSAILSDCGALRNHYKIKETFYVLKMVHDILNSPKSSSYKDKTMLKCH